ncbi:anaerobic carbon-monoxide dehydrogenase iron sulfur subunit [Desulfovibrionales bacterium]
MKRVYPNKDMCLGCRICELACLTVHSKSKDLIIAYTEERSAGLISSKVVYENGSVCVALSCRHCENPMCVAACISGALYKDQTTGKIMYSREKCVGCWSCLMACPFGAIRRNSSEGKIIKCDLCAGQSMPACVKACPNAALTWEERGTLSPPLGVLPVVPLA